MRTHHWDLLAIVERMTERVTGPRRLDDIDDLKRDLGRDLVAVRRIVTSLPTAVGPLSRVASLPPSKKNLYKLYNWAREQLGPAASLPEIHAYLRRERHTWSPLFRGARLPASSDNFARYVRALLKTLDTSHRELKKVRLRQKAD